MAVQGSHYPLVIAWAAAWVWKEEAACPGQGPGGVKISPVRPQTKSKRSLSHRCCGVVGLQVFHSSFTLQDMHFPVLPSCQCSGGLSWLCAESSDRALPLGSPMAALCAQSCCPPECDPPGRSHRLASCSIGCVVARGSSNHGVKASSQLPHQSREKAEELGT